MKIFRCIFILFLCLILLPGCLKFKSPEHRVLIDNLSRVYKTLPMGQETSIKLINFYGDYLKIITPPYVSKNEFMGVVKNAGLSEKLAWITASQEACHIFIINNNQLIFNALLPGYVDVKPRILSTNNKDIYIKVRRVNRASRSLLIEDMQ